MQGHFRFRANIEPGGDETRRRWRAAYSHEDGLSAFHVALDLARNTCTFRRTGEHDCAPMLVELARALVGEGAPAPTATARVDSLSFDAELLGLKMSRSSAAGSGPAAAPAFEMDPPGDWLVVRLFVPGGTQSFCLAVSDRQGSAEIVADQPGSGPAIVQALAQVLG